MVRECRVTLTARITRPPTAVLRGIKIVSHDRTRREFMPTLAPGCPVSANRCAERSRGTLQQQHMTTGCDGMRTTRIAHSPTTSVSTLPSAQTQSDQVSRGARAPPLAPIAPPAAPPAAPPRAGPSGAGPGAQPRAGSHRRRSAARQGRRCGSAASDARAGGGSADGRPGAVRSTAATCCAVAELAAAASPPAAGPAPTAAPAHRPLVTAQPPRAWRSSQG